MGLYDTVIVNCPQCNKEMGVQSKGGECSLYEYNIEECPDDVFSDINRHAPFNCSCGCNYKVDTSIKRIVVYSEDSEDKDFKITKLPPSIALLYKQDIINAYNEGKYGEYLSGESYYKENYENN